MSTRMASLLSVLALLAFARCQNNTTGLDPISNFCVRTDHQSTLKNGILYIDGGIETFVEVNNNSNPIGDIIYGYNTGLIAVNMSTSWDWKLNVSEAFIPKHPNPQTDAVPPIVSCSALYSGTPSDSKIYLYGGTTSFFNVSFPGFETPTSSQYTLWSFDTEARTWDQYDITNASPQRRNSGASAEAPDQGLAFYLNGQMDNGSAPTTAYLDSNIQFLEGMLVINTTSQEAQNVSTDSFSGSDPRTRGKMQYVPGVGSNGILVYLGGSSKSANNLDPQAVGDLVSMESIDVYDIASLFNDSTQAWYQQPASGDIPAPRIDHCLVGAWAPDNSSFNIYMYGGRGYGNDFYDQIYVLSLPSFRWIKVFEGVSPRFGMTCHTVGNRQMLTVGGFSSANLSLLCDWEVKSVAIYDMSTLIWGSVYNAADPPYQVPQTVFEVIGGSANGSANMTAPTPSWANGALAQLFAFNQSFSSSSSTPSSSPNSHHAALGKGAIAGIAVGGIFMLSSIVTLVLVIFLRQRKKRRHAKAAHTPPSMTNDLDARDERAMLDARDTEKPAEIMDQRAANVRDQRVGSVTMWHVELGPPALVSEVP